MKRILIGYSFALPKCKHFCVKCENVKHVLVKTNGQNMHPCAYSYVHTCTLHMWINFIFAYLCIHVSLYVHICMHADSVQFLFACVYIAVHIIMDTCIHTCIIPICTCICVHAYIHIFSESFEKSHCTFACMHNVTS